jgi:hypothetical protein
LVVLLEAPGGRGAATAIALARSLARRSPGPVVLADLTLDGLHRGLHGIEQGAPGLPELVASCRFAPPAPATLQDSIHRVVGGYDLLPGLRHHHDWVTVGSRSAAMLVAFLRSERATVVAHVDRDLEGEADTGSFDVEDRNVLARTAVRAADLVVVAGGRDRTGRQALLTTREALGRFGIPEARTLGVAVRWPVPFGSRAGSLGQAVRGALEPPDAAPRADADDGPQRIAPGSLGS